MGWTDSENGKEYALVGLSSHTAFVDMSDPANLILVGILPTSTVNSSWRDIKVYQDHAFIVSEAAGHGMQVFDLTRLRDVLAYPVQFEPDLILLILEERTISLLIKIQDMHMW